MTSSVMIMAPAMPAAERWWREGLPVGSLTVGGVTPLSLTVPIVPHSPSASYPPVVVGADGPMRDNPVMTTYRLSEAADVLGVSDDTVRRWVDAGRLPAVPGDGRSPTTIRGTDLAALAESLLDEPDREQSRASAVSARNRLGGIVTRVKKDHVMAQVEMVCGSHRMVSLMSADAADELGLEPGVRAVASVKSTHVVVEVP
jgi:molybdopterin-binding protein